jgi:uncharacterized tellurite resistance protein B-like protein
MLSALQDLFRRLAGDDDEPNAMFGPDDTRLAVAALLVHCMAVDGAIDSDEEAILRQVLGDEYGLSGKELDTLIATATEADNQAVDLYRFTSVIKRDLDREQRARVVEQLWKMVYADGTVHEFEDNLVWRIAELLGIERYERLARKNAVASHLHDDQRDDEE